ncbi:PadR family transcriptional regulator [Cellulomonas fimi]|uniref:PadR family transcriptional regulator n=1 Tax=Cellulomonas fimi TaxID=1708 RepID=A0A7Y0QHY5_CELFI|nr:PadR family transcriptional regulator [Cellulomonas fimi]
MSDAAWPSDWLRGVLEVCVLRVLADGPTYGYAIGARLAEVGLGTLKGGTLYPLLARFENAGLVAVEWRAGEGGPGRKYYALTPDGTRTWHEQASRWELFARLTTGFVASAPAAAPAIASGAVPKIATGRDDSPQAHATNGPQQVRDGARR